MSLPDPLLIERQGYWATHPYNRLNVEEYVEEFCGWQALTELFSLIYDAKQKAFFAATFLTGGRVTEVLLLKKYTFTDLQEEGIIKVTQMRLLKRYKKLDGYVDAEGKNRWHTQKFVKFRKTFTIQKREPFTDILTNYLKQINGSDVYLFGSPYSHSRKYMKKHLPSEEAGTSSLDANRQVPYSAQWAYINIREINRRASKDLKERLGLMRPYIDDEGVKISDEIHLWLHWLRSQRACQLVNDYDFEVLDLVNWFSWEDSKTALRYAKKGWRGLTEKMNNAHVQYT